MTTKPHKGTIDEWVKIRAGIGYFIVGISIDHPQFAGQEMHTSYVVSHVGDEIETRNSRYTLGEELKKY